MGYPVFNHQLILSPSSMLAECQQLSLYSNANILGEILYIFVNFSPSVDYDPKPQVR